MFETGETSHALTLKSSAEVHREGLCTVHKGLSHVHHFDLTVLNAKQSYLRRPNELIPGLRNVLRIKRSAPYAQRASCLCILAERCLQSAGAVAGKAGGEGSRELTNRLRGST